MFAPLNRKNAEAYVFNYFVNCEGDCDVYVKSVRPNVEDDMPPALDVEFELNGRPHVFTIWVERDRLYGEW